MASIQSYEDVAKAAMLEVWGRCPREYQLEVISGLLKMIGKERKRQGVLLVQCTGSGKSTIPQTVAVVDGGITVIIESTLALSTDQQSKFKTTSDRRSNIITFQLDQN